MKIYEIKLKVYLVRDVSKDKITIKITHFIDSAMSKVNELAEFHEKNIIKGYVFDQLYPVEKSGMYIRDKIYSFRIRTVNSKLAKFFNENLVNHYTDDMKGLKCDIKEINKKPLSVVYSLMPVIIKTEEGYWRKNLKIADFEQRIKNNILKKYREFTGIKVDQNIDLYTSIRVLNNTPCKFYYKDVCLLGDKIELIPSDDKLAQDILYVAIGAGIGELNSRGAGFLNYKYL